MSCYLKGKKCVMDEEWKSGNGKVGGDSYWQGGIGTTVRSDSSSISPSERRLFVARSSPQSFLMSGCIQDWNLNLSL